MNWTAVGITAVGVAILVSGAVFDRRTRWKRCVPIACPPMQEVEINAIYRQHIPGQNDFQAFYENFETVVYNDRAFVAEEHVIGGRPEIHWVGQRVGQPATFTRLPYGDLDLGLHTYGPHDHEFARALVDFDGRTWECQVCRHCGWVTPPVRPW